MAREVDVGPIVEPCTANRFLGKIEPERTNKVERCPGGGAGPTDRAGVLGDLRSYKYNLHRGTE
jgi:hypothetical protein